MATTDLGSIADAATALFNLIMKGLPTDPKAMATLQAYFPVITQRRILRAQKVKERELDQAKAYVLKHKVDPALFVQYLQGDTMMANLLTEEVNTKP